MSEIETLVFINYFPKRKYVGYLTLVETVTDVDAKHVTGNTTDAEPEHVIETGADAKPVTETENTTDAKTETELVNNNDETTTYRLRFRYLDTFVDPTDPSSKLQEEEDYYVGCHFKLNQEDSPYLITGYSICDVYDYTTICTITLDREIPKSVFENQHVQGSIQIPLYDQNSPYVFLLNGSPLKDAYKNMIFLNQTTMESRLIVDYDCAKRTIQLSSPFVLHQNFNNEKTALSFAIYPASPKRVYNLAIKDGTTTSVVFCSEWKLGREMLNNSIRFFSAISTRNEIRTITQVATNCQERNLQKFTFEPPLSEPTQAGDLFEIIFNKVDDVETPSSSEREKEDALTSAEQEQDTETESNTESTSTSVVEIDHIYVISIDNAPLFYTHSRQEAKEKLQSLSSRYVYSNIGSVYTYFVESEDDDEVVYIKGRLKFSVFSYDRIIHVLRFDRVDKIC